MELIVKWTVKDADAALEFFKALQDANRGFMIGDNLQKWLTGSPMSLVSITSKGEECKDPK